MGYARTAGRILVVGLAALAVGGCRNDNDDPPPLPPEEAVVPELPLEEPAQPPGEPEDDDPWGVAEQEPREFNSELPLRVFILHLDEDGWPKGDEDEVRYSYSDPQASFPSNHREHL